MCELPRVTVLPIVAVAALFWLAPAHAVSAAWCGGNDRASADRVPELQFAENQIHVVYATAADGPDNFAADAPLIVDDLTAIDVWWRGQDPTRTPRFDLYPFAGCAPGLGQLDLSFVRLSGAAATYQGEDGVQRIESELTSNTPSSVKTLAYYDGQIGDDSICGESQVLPAAGGMFAVSLVFLQACEPDLGAGVITAAAAAHEVTHNLGAVPTEAPHSCLGADAGHVCGDSADLMRTTAQPLAGAVLDVGRDDYYGHSGSWWDVQDSPWLERLPLQPLTVVSTGTGGSVVSLPGSLACTATCTVQVDNDTWVTLGATPRAGSRLVGWSGACSGSGKCAVRMDGAKLVTALFGPASYRLAVSVSGKGRVTGPGLSCPARCQGSVAGGGSASLRAAAAKGYRFAGWGGDCHGAGGCVVKGDTTHRVSARFVRR
jgi:hypothetical protein